MKTSIDDVQICGELWPAIFCWQGNLVDDVSDSHIVLAILATKTEEHKYYCYHPMVDVSS
jgi:hypothetical protein